MKNELNEQILKQLAVIMGREKGDLATAIRTLDSLKAPVKGHLSHYLEKRSYEKAWILLNDETPKKGSCS